MSPQSPRSAKEREAMANRYGIANPNQPQGEAGGSGRMDRDDDEPVVVHQDAGRVRQEIPPAYDSIQQDQDTANEPRS